jgi:hypothetical protein
MNGFNTEDAQPKPGFKSYMANTNNSVRNSNRDRYVPNMKLPKLEKILSTTKDDEGPTEQVNELKSKDRN